LVQLTDGSLADYPRVTNWLRRSLAELEGKEWKRWNAFVMFSALPASLARSALTGASGLSPILRIAPLDRMGLSINGEFRPWEPKYIYLCDTVAERAKVDLDDRQECRDFIQSTVLHEAVHWALANYQHRELGEPGVLFECVAYGSNLGRYWMPGSPSSCGTSDAHHDVDTGMRRTSAFEPDPAMVRDVPMARVRGGGRAWPVDTAHPRRYLVSYEAVSGLQIGDPGRAFGTSWLEDGTPRKAHRAGVDLYGMEGDAVLACEAGTILGASPFFQSTMAVLIRCSSGQVISYGGIAPGSWGKLKQGDRVRAGQEVARLGKSSRGSMCHFEMYAGDTTTPVEWPWGHPVPVGLLNPTEYLRSLAYEKQPRK